MTKKILIVLTSAILIVGGLFLFQRARSSQSLKPNQTAQTGVTIVFTEPVNNADLSVTNSQGQIVKQLGLTGSGTRYNLELPPGIYSLGIASPDNSFPPLESAAVTVIEQKLTEVSFVLPAPHEE